jgi:uncharacterized protein YodC (DUF2158 family)
MAEFKQGEVVRLKSGGPPLTVEATEGGETVCCWFGLDHGEYRRRHIVTGLLTLVSQPPAAAVKR